jgi:glyoxylase-like metal-dependent hydrolase (beta-lactamase superfamily II)
LSISFLFRRVEGRGSFFATRQSHTNITSFHRNWKTFDERSFDFCQGITLHHLPGHTDGLVGMQINLPDSGTIFFISDHCHVIENVSIAVSVPVLVFFFLEMKLG